MTTAGKAERVFGDQSQEPGRDRYAHIHPEELIFWSPLLRSTVNKHSFSSFCELGAGQG